MFTFKILGQSPVLQLVSFDGLLTPASQSTHQDSFVRSRTVQFTRSVMCWAAQIVENAVQSLLEEIWRQPFRMRGGAADPNLPQEQRSINSRAQARGRAGAPGRCASCLARPVGPRAAQPQQRHLRCPIGTARCCRSSTRGLPWLLGKNGSRRAICASVSPKRLLIDRSPCGA